MNTYLCSKPSFTSPQPLAAASGLTIPLQITLSEIKLSAFIIVVFSRQKGLTLVFRNDPLESLKVSSTFDSIQFVRDYLQKTIEVKLRDLMMEELPAIIHRLSLRLWCPDQAPKDGDELKDDEKEGAINPLGTPPLDAVDAKGHLLDPSELSSLSLDGGPEMQSLFSQKNLEQLKALLSSHLTSSPDSPTLSESMYRAWAGVSDKLDAGYTTPATPNLGRSSSFQGSTHTYTFSDADSQHQGFGSSRSSMVNLSQATAGLSLGSGRRSMAGRKKKNRVVNLRRTPGAGSEENSEMGDSSTASDMASTASEALTNETILEEPVEIDMAAAAAAASAANKVRFRPSPEPIQPRKSLETDSREALLSQTAPIRLAEKPVQGGPSKEKAEGAKSPQRPGRSRSDTSSVILEQAWIMKMAGEIARRVYEEKHRNPGFWDERDEREEAPPAYEAS